MILVLVYKYGYKQVNPLNCLKMNKSIVNLRGYKSSW